MKTVDELKDYLREQDSEDTVFFSNPYYLEAIVGFTDDCRLVYDYELMMESLVNEGEMNHEEAADFITFNTLNIIPNAGEKAPVVMYRIP